MPQLALKPVRVARLTLPDHKNLPTLFAQRLDRRAVSLHIPLKLVHPKFMIVFRGGCGPAAPVPMPETSVHQNDAPQSGENEIGRSRQITSMQAEPKPHRMGHAAHDELGFRILAPYRPHHAAPRLGHDVVHYQSQGAVAAP
jgi:hypothetical protein